MSPLLIVLLAQAPAATGSSAPKASFAGRDVWDVHRRNGFRLADPESLQLVAPEANTSFHAWRAFASWTVGRHIFSLVGFSMDGGVSCSGVRTAACSDVSYAALGFSWRPWGSRVSVFGAVSATAAPVEARMKSGPGVGFGVHAKLRPALGRRRAPAAKR